MTDLLAVPLKKPTEVDIVKPLKNIISSSYSTADKPQDYTEAINELSKQRNNAVWRVFEKYESSLEVIYGYYDQLSALEGKIPAHEVQIPFKWKDAFDKGSIFGGRISLTVSSLAYEKVCVLFNIAALQSSIAAAQSLESDEGLKLAAKLFQQSSGLFNHLKGNVMLAIQQEPTPDLNPETLGALSSLMLAQAQEIFVQKAIHDKMKDAIIAKLCSQCEELFAEVLKLFQKELLRPLWEKEWIPIIAGKQAAYHSIAEFYQSLVCKANKSVGEEIARLDHSLELLKAAQQRSGKPSFFQDFGNKIQRNLTEAKKDNDFIYHERIPDAKNLTPVGKAQLAKMLPLPERMSQNFKDLFGELVPVTVHQALAAYDVRKNEIVNTEIMKLRESTQFLNSVLASLNLPAALEDTSGSALPKSLVEKANAVRSLGGLDHLESVHQELPELLQRNKDILDEAERLLREETESDQQLRSQFKDRWNRTPSEKLTETFRANATKYREIITNAVQADRIVREKLDTHRRGMKLLSGGESALAAAVPSAGSSRVADSSAVHRLRRLMETVVSLKAERDGIEAELKSATTDMQSSFLTALARDGAINEPALSIESLGHAYGPLQKRVQESVNRQESLMADIQTANTEFCGEKSGAGGAAQRETILKELAAAHDAFMELKSNLNEGAKFYNDLTQLLVIFQNKISDFCFARKTEKEELLKDLTQDAARQSSAPPRPPQPQLSQDGKSAPAAPTAMAGPSSQGTPYPSYPTGMPVPYGASAAAPYPAYVPPPMPQGYNPYAPVPYPQQPGVYGNFPSYPVQGYPAPGQGYPPQGYPGGYPGYPGAPPQQPQQPPHQNNPQW